MARTSRGEWANMWGRGFMALSSLVFLGVAGYLIWLATDRGDGSCGTMNGLMVAGIVFTVLYIVGISCTVCGRSLDIDMDEALKTVGGGSSGCGGSVALIMAILLMTHVGTSGGECEALQDDAYFVGSVILVCLFAVPIGTVLVMGCLGCAVGQATYGPCTAGDVEKGAPGARAPPPATTYNTDRPN